MNIFDLLQKFHITPKKVSNSKGGEYHSPCPGCGGEDRFHVWPVQHSGNGSYWCRGCGCGGDNIQFLIDFENMTFKEARRYLGLAEMDAGPVSTRRQRQPRPANVWHPEDKEHPAVVTNLACWREHALKFVEYCHQELLKNEKEMAWLAARGIPADVVKQYRLGLNIKTTFRPRTSWGLAGGTNPKTKKPQMFVLPAGIVIPWFVDGRLHRVRVRLAEPDPKNPKKKYHAVIGSAMDTFITRHEAQTYMVMETELDAIMIDAQAGALVGAMAVGSSHAKPTARAAALLADADRILDALDNDKAGNNAGLWWQENFRRYYRLLPPKGKDPGEAYQAGGDIAAWIRAALPASQKISSINDVLSLPSADHRQRHPQGAKKQPAAPVEKSMGPQRDLHPDIIAMADLLAQCPVLILVGIRSLQIKKLINFKHELHFETKGRISKLLFSSIPVMKYLDKHPATKISANNFLLEAQHAA